MSENPKKRKRFSIDSMDELAKKGKNIPEPRRLLGDFIIENSLVHFPSERGTGKTFFAIQICLAISNNASSFINERIQVNGNTLYINCELNEDTIASRLHKLYQNPPFKIDSSSPFIAKVFTTRNTFSSNKSEILEEIQSLKPVLVVLDNWKTAFADVETANEIADLMRDLLDLKDEYRFALLVLDHTKKGSKLQITDSDLQSGSGTKSDLADSDFFLRKSTKDKNFRILKRIKSRYAPDQEGAKLLEFDCDTLWFNCHTVIINEMEYLDHNDLKNDTEDMHRIIYEIYTTGNHTMEGVAKMFNMSKSNVSLIVKKMKNKS
jgi:predicted ATP-dependent serine protease